MNRVKFVAMTTLMLLIATVVSAQVNNILPTAPLKEFDALQIDAQMKVTLVQVSSSEPQRIVYDMGDNDYEKFKFTHKTNGVLSVTLNSNTKAMIPATATIYYHNIKSLTIRSAEVLVEDYKSSISDIKVDYKGSLTGDVTCDDLLLSVYADSWVEITGSVRYITVDASSRAKVELRALDVTSADVTTASGAVVAIKADDRLATKVGSNSEVKYWGDPTILRNQKMMMGGTLSKQ